MVLGLDLGLLATNKLTTFLPLEKIFTAFRDIRDLNFKQ